MIFSLKILKNHIVRCNFLELATSCRQAQIKFLNRGNEQSKVCGIGPVGFPINLLNRRRKKRFPIKRLILFCSYRIATESALQSPVHPITTA